MRTRQSNCVIGVVILLLTGRGLADGMMLPLMILPGLSVRQGEAVAMVESPRQEAIMTVQGGAVRVILRIHFNAGPKELAWVVPVPDMPTDIDSSDDAVFEHLDGLTAPRFYREIFKPVFMHLKCGCGSGAEGESTVAEIETVTVEATGQAGIFDYTVLSATDVDDLTDWLNEHGYYVPADIGKAIQPYVDGGWYWLAMRVSAEQTDRQRLAPHPVTYTYQADELVYPLIISSLSAAEENEVLLYVVADRQYECANWANMTAGELAGEPEPVSMRATMPRAARVAYLELRDDTPSGTNYEALFRRQTASHDGHLFITEYVGSHRDAELHGPGGLDSSGAALPPVLTRLRAIMSPAAMDRDVELQPTDTYPRQYEFHIAGNRVRRSNPGAMGMAILFFALLGVGHKLWGRSGWRRAAGYGLAAAACIVLTML